MDMITLFKLVDVRIGNTSIVADKSIWKTKTFGIYTMLPEKPPERGELSWTKCKEHFHVHVHQ